MELQELLLGLKLKNCKIHRYNNERNREMENQIPYIIFYRNASPVYTDIFFQEESTTCFCLRGWLHG
jgi:hypothetical protein